jgi:hypothetical protein
LSKNYQSILRQAQDDPTSSGWPDKLGLTGHLTSFDKLRMT